MVLSVKYDLFTIARAACVIKLKSSSSVEFPSSSLEELLSVTDQVPFTVSVPLVATTVPSVLKVTYNSSAFGIIVFNFVLTNLVLLLERFNVLDDRLITHFDYLVFLFLGCQTGCCMSRIDK